MPAGSRPLKPSTADRQRVRKTLLDWNARGPGRPPTPRKKPKPYEQYGTLVALEVGGSTVWAMCEQRHEARYSFADFRRGRCRVCQEEAATRPKPDGR